MKKLILIRHSFAESGSGASSDFKRNLTLTGKKIALLQAEILKSNLLIPDLVLTSNANRALQTTFEFSEVLKPKYGIKEINLLYTDYTTADFFNLINQVNNKVETLAIIGHNPSVSAMASRLDPETYLGFKPCSMAVFTIPVKWDALQVGDAKIEQYFSS